MTALKHASLVGQDLEQLKPGRSVLRRDDNGVLWTFGSLARDGNWINLTSGGAVTCSLVSRLEYIGELADDGFITCPEGGWGKNPAPGMRVDFRLRGFGMMVHETSELSDALQWNTGKPGRPQDIIAFRPTPAGDFGALQPQGASVPTEKMEHQVRVFLDCDGVLADFDEAGRILWGEEPRAYEARVGSNRFWQELEDRGDFYRTLPLMPDAMALYDGVKHLNPTILTGCPRGNWAEAQKVDWAARHFPGVEIITCRSSDKRAHAKPGDVLIDDWHQHRHRWVEMGGVWISHTCAETSLATLWAYYPYLHPSKQVGMEAEGRNAPKAPSDNPAGEVERLRAALKPFADASARLHTGYDDGIAAGDRPMSKVFVSDLRNAAAALEASQ